MVLMTLTEVANLIILTVALGYIFMDFISQHRPRTTMDVYKKRFDKRDFYFAMLITAPAVVLHELAHKFMAMGLGFESAFHIWPAGLGFAIFLKLIASPFLIIAPGYVSIPTDVPMLTRGLIAFAGPAINLVLYGISFAVMTLSKALTQRQFIFWALTRRINGVLFVFNMLPIWVLDGRKVLDAILCYFNGSC